MAGLTNLQIASTARSHFHTRDYFKGCFCIDTLPKHKINYPSFIVCNSATAQSGGEHWLCIGLPGGDRKPAEVFDSLGRPLTSYHKSLTEFLMYNSNGQYTINSQRFQAENSDTCGYYSLWFADMRCRNMAYSKCLSLLDPQDCPENDRYVTSYVMQHMGLARIA